MNIFEKWETLRKIVEVNYGGELFTENNEMSFYSYRIKRPNVYYITIGMTKYIPNKYDRLKISEITIGYDYYYDYYGISLNKFYLFYAPHATVDFLDKKSVYSLLYQKEFHNQNDIENLQKTLGIFEECNGWIDDMIINLL